MMREIITCMLLPSVLVAQPSTIWNRIKLAKEILEFIGELPEWINHNKNLEEHLQNLRSKINCLEAVETDVINQLENTEIQSGKKRKREVDLWLRSVRKKADEVSYVEDDINTVSYIPRFLFRAWLGSCIKKEIKLLRELLEQGRFPEGLLLDIPQDGREPFVTNGLIGQLASEKLNEIWAHLINPRTVKIGVLGPQGIGKSAIMAHVFNRLCPYNDYYPVYYVNVPQNFTIFSLQAAIAAEMNAKVPLHEGSELGRAARIFKVLRSKKEFVLILDGLSQEFDLHKVGIPNEGIGQKLILTSRSRDVCTRMACQETVLLERMSREDSESLFMEKLGPNAPLSEEIRDVAHEIVAKCEGIPSRIINMADQLRGCFDINEWRTTMNEM